jgi:hypothetical protein
MQATEECVAADDIPTGLDLLLEEIATAGALGKRAQNSAPEKVIVSEVKVIARVARVVF